MALITDEKIVLITSHFGGVRVETYRDIQDMFFRLMNNGSIGKRGDYGSVHHRLALRKIEKNLARVRAYIAKHNAEHL